MEVLNIDGVEYKTQLTKKYKQRKAYAAANASEIRTVIPGKVVKLNVKEGSKVKHGDVIMLFEAMKMQNIIYAPCNGEISGIAVKEGDSLPKGAVMMCIA